MKTAIVIAGMLLAAFNAYNQAVYKKISSQVRDIRNEPLASATVKLLHATDSSVIEVKTTRENGKFQFDKLANGTYRVQVSSAGNKIYTSAMLTIDDAHPEIILPVIVLMPGRTVELKEVTVTSRRPLIEQELDKLVVNADAMIGSATGSTLEILEKTPGVTVDVDGTITLNGNGSVLVLVEGRTVHLSGADLAAYLRSLPGSMVDKIELMTNPPAKYDAAGGSIINIRLKRNRVKGYTGSLSTSANLGQETFRSYSTVAINYLERKVNLFVNAAYSKDANTNDDLSTRNFYEPDGTKNAGIDIANRWRYRSKEISGRAGLDYTLSSRTVAGMVLSYNYRPRREQSDYNSTSYQNSGDVDSMGTGTMTGKYRWKQSGANANLSHKFNDRGQEIAADVNYIRYSNPGDQLLHNSVFSPSVDSSYDFLYALGSRIDIYNAKIDYMQPLGKIKLSAGVKSSWVTNSIASDYFNFFSGIYQPDPAKSNHFIYRENINAVYLNARRDWKRIGLQAGLRAENTITKGEQPANAATAGTVFRNNYTKLFPSFFLSYKLDSAGKHTVSLNVTRRLNRPNYQQLNPFLFFRDQYSFTSGNPALGPTYGIKYELSYRFGQYLGLSVQHDRLTDNIIDYTQAEGSVFITRPANRGEGHMTALLLNSSYSPVKRWTINLNAGTAGFYNRAVLEDEIVELRRQAYRANIFTQFAFKNDWSAEIFAMWLSRIIQWQRIMEPRWRMNAAIQKKLFKKRGAIKLSAEDVFYSWRTETSTVGLKNISYLNTSIQDTRRVSISFNLSFGKETFARKRKVNDAADDLKGRVE